MSKMAQAIANHINCCIKFTPQQFGVTLTNGTPVPLSSSPQEFRYALVIGTKDLSGTPNTGVVGIGVGSVDGTDQPLRISPGQTYVLPLPPGAKSDFADWNALSSNDGDNLAILYF